MKKKILLLSGYDAASHRYWRDLLCENLSQFDWTQLALPDRHFSWRIRGNSLNFAFQYQQQVSDRYDLIIATSMVDLASLRGFVPQLAQTPTLVYFHENQFVYPVSGEGSHSNNQANAINAQLTSLYSALCADHILFNSNYNRMTFLSGVRALIKKLPDKFPEKMLNDIENRSDILAVPVLSKTQVSVNNKIRNDHTHIVWNHRWEYDKQPQVFFDAMKLLKQSGYRFRLHVLGQSFRNVPNCFQQAEKDFANEILTFGFQTQQKYQEILEQSDIVVSSALHDFQGLSLMEAILKGCKPVAPNRVAYPEYVAQSNLYSVNNNEIEAESLFKKLKEVLECSQIYSTNLAQYHCGQLIPKYQKVIESLIYKN